jgi:hypothetical protein
MDINISYPHMIYHIWKTYVLLKDFQIVKRVKQTEDI